jgi:hypothetical protein
MRKTILAAIVVLSSGCGVIFPDIIMAGSAEGYRALADGENALITNIKSQDPKGDSAAWQHRKQQEQEITKRGFFQKLLGGSSTSSRGEAY